MRRTKTVTPVPTPPPSVTYSCRCPIYKDAKHLSLENCLVSMNARYEIVKMENNRLISHFGVDPEETEYNKCGCGSPLFKNLLTGAKILVCPPCMKLAFDQLMLHAKAQAEKIKQLEAELKNPKFALAG